MKSLLITLCLILIIFAVPGLSQSAAEQRTALVIGNGNYTSGPLKNPINDATDMAAALRKAGFTVVLKKDATLQVMEDALEDFGNKLKRGGVGLFYYAGHGVQVGGANYLIPTGAKINKESDIKFKALDAGRVLAEMENANNGLNIVILDACRDNPFGKKFRSASRGLAIVSNAPVGTFISYSTGAGQVASDGDGRNSPYTAALLKYMKQPGMPINDVFMNVRQKLRKDTGQVPWELSSLEGRFYFTPAKASNLMEAKVAPAEPEQTGTPSFEPNEEKQKVEAEREKLRQEKELLKQKEVLAAEKKELEEQEKQLAMGARPSSVRGNEIKKDGRFIAYDNGTVLDTKTNLMWASKDNGSDINWQNAKSYCENYRGGGYTDWRMPTLSELAGLYPGESRFSSCSKYSPIYVATNLINISCFHVWSSESRSPSGGVTKDFYKDGTVSPWIPSNDNGTRALPVRNVASGPIETRRDGRFIAYDNGTVLDTRTNLMWAAKDNGSDISWSNAKSYCENYRGGGYTDWRMPTKDELTGLYDKTKRSKAAKGREVYMTELIQLTRSTWVWASDTRGSHAAYLTFGAMVNIPEPEWTPKHDSLGALPVRSVK